MNILIFFLFCFVPITLAINNKGYYFALKDDLSSSTIRPIGFITAISSPLSKSGRNICTYKSIYKNKIEINDSTNTNHKHVKLEMYTLQYAKITEPNEMNDYYFNNHLIKKMKYGYVTTLRKTQHVTNQLHHIVSQELNAVFGINNNNTYQKMNINLIFILLVVFCFGLVLLFIGISLSSRSEECVSYFPWNIHSNQRKKLDFINGLKMKHVNDGKCVLFIYSISSSLLHPDLRFS